MIEKLAKQLHEWYLEATDLDGVRYNPEAVVPWDDLPDSSKIIDRYIAEKVLTQVAEEARREERERIVHEWNNAGQRLDGTALGAINCIEYFDNHL